jgi:hypothetical protein
MGYSKYFCDFYTHIACRHVFKLFIFYFSNELFSDSTVSEDAGNAGIDPRTVATLALEDRRSNQSTRSHPDSARSHPHSARSHLYSASSQFKVFTSSIETQTFY